LFSGLCAEKYKPSLLAQNLNPVARAEWKNWGRKSKIGDFSVKTRIWEGIGQPVKSAKIAMIIDK